MLLLAPAEIPSITIYLLGAVSVKALYLVVKREKTLSEEKTLEESTRKSERQGTKQTPQTVNSESSS